MSNFLPVLRDEIRDHIVTPTDLINAALTKRKRGRPRTSMLDRKADRHRPGYMAEYMRAYRKRKKGKT